MSDTPIKAPAPRIKTKTTITAKTAKMVVSHGEESHEVDLLKLPKAVVPKLLSIAVDVLARRFIKTLPLADLLGTLSAGSVPEPDTGKPGRHSDLAIALSRVSGVAVELAAEKIAGLDGAGKAELRLNTAIATELGRIGLERRGKKPVESTNLDDLISAVTGGTGSREEQPAEPSSE